MLRTRSMICLLFTLALGAPLASGHASPNLGACQKAVAKESAAYVRSVVQTVDKCLAKMSTDVVQKGAGVTAAADRAAGFCAAAFARLADTGAAKELAVKFDTKVARQCGGGAWDAALGAANLGEYCATLGGDGSVDDFAEWTTCLRAAADAEARAAIATRWPRALEYLGALAAALPTSAARTALVAFDAAIEGPVEDDTPDPPAVTTGLLRTGAHQCKLSPYSLELESCARAPKDQDGFAQAGFAPQDADNGDGTITDRVTGLTWEKLGHDGSIHDAADLYTFADAVDAKIAALNAAEFAGHADWRLPNRRELESLVDAGKVGPAIRSAFDDACVPGCSVLECSCTPSEPYWTSTAYQARPSEAWVVDFHQGMIFPGSRQDTAHVRAVRGGRSVAALAPAAPRARDNASASLAACQKAVATESAKYVRAVTGSVGKCLERMSSAVVDEGATPAVAARAAAPVCDAALRKLRSSASPERALGGKLDAKLAAKCDPDVNPGLSHLDADTWTIGARTLAAANLGAYCAQHGGAGTIETFAAWQRCVHTAADAQAREAIALRWPRALEYFAALAAELAAAKSGTSSDARLALAAVDAAIEGTTDDDQPEPPAPPPAGLLATGQTECVQDDLATLGPCPGGPAQQDGEVRAGLARSYTDNGDGTITDHVTGLMWEKLSDDGSIHDRDHDYDNFRLAFFATGGAHFNKVARLNRHRFAGYADWRVPNRRELESLIDAGRVAPAIDPIFERDCTPGCSVLECSCTASTKYISSTIAVFPSGAGEATTVDFNDGAVGILGHRVRAVRGGNANTHVNQPPVAVSNDMKHPWKNDCFPVSIFGYDDDSTLLFLELVTPPVHGFLDSVDMTLMPADARDTLPQPANGQIAAAMPDLPHEWWGPYDHGHHWSYNLFPGKEPGERDMWGTTVCYVPFSDTFTGTDSFSFRIRDNEGAVSATVPTTITIFEN